MLNRRQGMVHHDKRNVALGDDTGQFLYLAATQQGRGLRALHPHQQAVDNIEVDGGGRPDASSSLAAGSRRPLSAANIG